MSSNKGLRLIRCPNKACGSHVRPGKFCTECGQALPQRNEHGSAQSTTHAP